MVNCLIEMQDQLSYKQVVEATLADGESKFLPYLSVPTRVLLDCDSEVCLIAVYEVTVVDTVLLNGPKCTLTMNSLCRFA